MINYMQEQEERAKAFAKALTTEEFFTHTANLNPQDYNSSREYKDYQIQKNKLEISDITWKNKARKNFGITFTIILIVQNLFVICLVMLSFSLGKISEASTVLSVVIPATLLETAYIIKIMIAWIFSNTDYFNHKKPEK
jgi:hypothetical protein